MSQQQGSLKRALTADENNEAVKQEGSASDRDQGFTQPAKLLKADKASPTIAALEASLTKAGNEQIAASLPPQPQAQPPSLVVPPQDTAPSSTPPEPTATAGHVLPAAVNPSPMTMAPTAAVPVAPDGGAETALKTFLQSQPPQQQQHNMSSDTLALLDKLRQGPSMALNPHATAAAAMQQAFSGALAVGASQFLQQQQQQQQPHQQQQPDMPQQWSALLQQANLQTTKSVPAQPNFSSFASLDNSAGLGAGFAGDKLMAAALGAVFSSNGGNMAAVLTSAVQSAGLVAASKRPGTSNMTSGDGGRPPKDTPKLSRAHLKEELLVNQVLEMFRVTHKPIPDALRTAQKLMEQGGGQLPPDTVIPPAQPGKQGVKPVEETGSAEAVGDGSEGNGEAVAQVDDGAAAQPKASTVVLSGEFVGSRASRRSHYRGVEWDRSCGKWRARITHQGKKLSLGSHVSEKEAARVYNDAALRLKGDNAHLNEVDDDAEEAAPEPADTLEPMMQGKSVFRGVTWDRRENRWRARITYQGKHKAIGRFATEFAAALAYDKTAIVLLAERARTNFDKAMVTNMLQASVGQGADDNHDEVVDIVDDLGGLAAALGGAVPGSKGALQQEGQVDAKARSKSNGAGNDAAPLPQQPTNPNLMAMLGLNNMQQQANGALSGALGLGAAPKRAGGALDGALGGVMDMLGANATNNTGSALDGLMQHLQGLKAQQGAGHTAMQQFGGYPHMSDQLQALVTLSNSAQQNGAASWASQFSNGALANNNVPSFAPSQLPAAPNGLQQGQFGIGSTMGPQHNGADLLEQVQRIFHNTAPAAQRSSSVQIDDATNNALHSMFQQLQQPARSSLSGNPGASANSGDLFNQALGSMQALDGRGAAAGMGARPGLLQNSNGRLAPPTANGAFVGQAGSMWDGSSNLTANALGGGLNLS